MTAAGVVDVLRDQLATVYPSRVVQRAGRVGRVSCVVSPTSGTYQPAGCVPAPVTVEAVVSIVAATSDETGVRDLLTHIDGVAEQVRAAGWTPERWEDAPGVWDVPAIRMTVTIETEG